MNHDHNHTDSNGAVKHLLLMVACCFIPIALIGAISLFGLSIGSLTPLLPYALILICPLLMFFMMRGMGHAQEPNEPHEPKTDRAPN